MDWGRVSVGILCDIKNLPGLEINESIAISEVGWLNFIIFNLESDGAQKFCSLCCLGQMEL